jgi:hypothetical protein
LVTDGFREILPKVENFTWTPPAPERCNILFRLPSGSSLLQIFLNIVSEELLDVIVNEVNARPKNNSYDYFDINIRMIYQTLALSIRIQGLQNRPLRNEQHDRPLRNSIKLAIEHFKY